MVTPSRGKVDMLDGSQPNQRATAGGLSARKRFLFAIICGLLPLAGIGVLELALRAAGLGGHPPVFRKVGEVPGGELVITDHSGTVSYFFANKERPGYNDQYSFLHPKPPNTFRVFLAGESAIKGYPQPRNLASSAFLQAMLQDAWPERRIEVINLGTTAVASFPVREIMTAALDFEPDLVVVYTGHNEFYGTYGVASIGRAGSRPWMLKAHRVVRSLAIVQGMERLLPDAAPGANRTLMETMVGQSHVAADDWRRVAAATNLRHNLGRMIENCRARNVPMLICTQPSNERDLAPIGADRRDLLPPDVQQTVQSLVAAAEKQSRDEPDAAQSALKRVLELAPWHARAHFLLGRLLSDAGEHAEAREHFNKARDLDPMPWRTPAALQQAIVDAARHAKADVCDVAQAFRNFSPGGAIGWELMDDHVHPTLRGQALIAETIVNSLASMSGTAHLTPVERARIAGWETYAQRLGDNQYDRYGVAHQMRVLFDVPFMRNSNPGAFARFDGMIAEFETGADPEVLAALREWQTARPHAGARRPITAMVARVLMRQKRFAEAHEFFEIAQKSVPEYTSWHMEYVYFTLACREKIHGSLTESDRALALQEIEQGTFLLSRGFSESGFTERHTGRLHQLRGEFAEAIPFLQASRVKLSGFDLVAADQALVVSYARTGQFDKARELAEYGAKNAGQFAGLYRNMLAELPLLERAASPPITKD
jgi:tetratricopeptide (TPR) repeat protein